MCIWLLRWIAADWIGFDSFRWLVFVTYLILFIAILLSVPSYSSGKKGFFGPAFHTATQYFAPGTGGWQCSASVFGMVPSISGPVVRESLIEGRGLTVALVVVVVTFNIGREKGMEWMEPWRIYGCTCSHRLTARFIRRYHSSRAGISPFSNTISPHAQLLCLFLSFFSPSVLLSWFFCIWNVFFFSFSCMWFCLSFCTIAQGPDRVMQRRKGASIEADRCFMANYKSIWSIVYDLVNLI